MYVCVCAQLQNAYSQKHTHTVMYESTYVCLYIQIYSYAYTYIHTYKHMYIYYWKTCTGIIHNKHKSIMQYIFGLKKEGVWNGWWAVGVNRNRAGDWQCQSCATLNGAKEGVQGHTHGNFMWKIDKYACCRKHKHTYILLHVYRKSYSNKRPQAHTHSHTYTHKGSRAKANEREKKLVELWARRTCRKYGARKDTWNYCAKENVFYLHLLTLISEPWCIIASSLRCNGSGTFSKSFFSPVNFARIVIFSDVQSVFLGFWAI